MWSAIGIMAWVALCMLTAYTFGYNEGKRRARPPPPGSDDEAAAVAALCMHLGKTVTVTVHDDET